MTNRATDRAIDAANAAPHDHVEARPPAAVLAAGGVFLPAHVCEPIWRILRAELALRCADGGRVRPDMAAALDALRAAALEHLAVSVNGPASRTSTDMGASCEPDKPLLTTGELAARLGCTERHARRLAAAERIAPAARGLWRAEDAAALVAARRTEHYR